MRHLLVQRHRRRSGVLRPCVDRRGDRQPVPGRCRRHRWPRPGRDHRPDNRRTDLGATGNRSRARRRREEEDPRDGRRLVPGSPENAGGWHYQAHYEYIVLYDSNPDGSTFPHGNGYGCRSTPSAYSAPGNSKSTATSRRLAARRPRPDRTRPQRDAAGHPWDDVRRRPPSTTKSPAGTRSSTRC